MLLSKEDKAVIALCEQLTRLGLRPIYLDSLRSLLKGENSEDTFKRITYGVHMYRMAFEYERENAGSFFHAYLGIFKSVGLLPHMNTPWLDYHKDDDFLEKIKDDRELDDVAAVVLREKEYENFNPYQDDVVSVDLKGIDYQKRFTCPSGLIVKYGKNFYIIKSRMKNDKMLFRDAKTQGDKDIKKDISKNRTIWKEIPSFVLARLIEIDDKNRLKVRESPTYVIPEFGTDAAKALRQFGGEYGHASKSQFLSYAHKDLVEDLRQSIRDQEDEWEKSVKTEFADNVQMQSDLKNLYAFYKKKSGGTSTEARSGRRGRVPSSRDQSMEIENVV